jgi:hypothetical protein
MPPGPFEAVDPNVDGACQHCDIRVHCRRAPVLELEMQIRKDAIFILQLADSWPFMAHVPPSTSRFVDAFAVRGLRRSRAHAGASHPPASPLTRTLCRRSMRPLH